MCSSDLEFTFGDATYHRERVAQLINLYLGGGLDGPLRSLPQNSIARAKPALERAASFAWRTVGDAGARGCRVRRSANTATIVEP